MSNKESKQESNKESNLIWIDLEMTGLDTSRDSIIELATIVTDKHLNVLAEGPVLAIYQPESVLQTMDDWNQHHHGKSGLIDRVRCSEVSLAQAEAATLEFLSVYVAAGRSPMCGNSICQDRRFLHRCMPKLEAYFHYRNLDVSSLNILVQQWAPHLLEDFHKVSTHQALADIQDSIAELLYYRKHFLKLSENDA